MMEAAPPERRGIAMSWQITSHSLSYIASGIVGSLLAYKGVISAAFLKDATDPQWNEDPGMKEVSDDRTVMRARLLDELATLKGSPAVDTSRLGAIGFCFGGQCVLDLARAGADIKGGVSFHGVYDAPPFPNAPMSAKLLICHGWNDPLSSPDALVGLAS
jgi:dienelactone hydrolase